MMLFYSGPLLSLALGPGRVPCVAVFALADCLASCHLTILPCACPCSLVLSHQPTGDLDSRNTIDIMNLLLGINLHEKKTLLMVTHNPDVECYGDRVLYIQVGWLVAVGCC